LRDAQGSRRGRGNKAVTPTTINQYREESDFDLLDLTFLGGHPLHLTYSEVYGAALINGDVDHGRIQPGVKIANHPYTSAARMEVELRGRETSMPRSPSQIALSTFFASFQPRNGAEWFGVDNSSTFLNCCKPWEALPPWRARDPSFYGHLILKSAHEELVENHQELIKECPGGTYWAKCGPVNPIVLDSEDKRLRNLITSMKIRGFLRSNDVRGDIKATALVKKNGDWRWLVSSGYHRSCVAVALGLREIPIRINLVIREGESDYWPQVRAGRFSKALANRIFNNIFDGIHSAF